MTEAIILALVGVGEAIITAIVTFKLTKRKYNSEVDNNLINNMKESLDFYKKLSDDNKKRLDDVLVKNDKLESEIDDLRKQLFSIMSQICTRVMCQERIIDPALCPYVRSPYIPEGTEIMYGINATGNTQTTEETQEELNEP